MDTQTNNGSNPTAAGDGGAAATEAAPPAASQPGDRPAEPLDALKAEAAKAKENWERLLRVMADFENYKKRMLRERQEAGKFAYVPLIEKLIPVLDHFEVALAAAQGASTESVQAFRDGIVMIHQQLRSALSEAGLEEIDAVGQPFDPNWHEAVSHQASADVPDGQVILQRRRGYKFRDRLLRPATVVVARAPDDASAADQTAPVTQGEP